MKVLNSTVIVIVFILLCIYDVHAQNTSIADAFSKSYEYEKKSDYKGAIAALAPVYNKSSYEMNLRMGWLFYKEGIYKESETYYLLAINLKPAAVEPRLGYVYPAYALGNTNEIKAQYAKILSIDPQNTTANYQMGMILYDSKDYSSAYKYFGKVVTLYPFTYDALIMYAWCSYKLGKKDEAIELFNRVLCLSPSDKSALEGLSMLK